MPLPLINPYTGLVAASRGTNLQVQQAVEEFQKRQKDEAQQVHNLLSQQRRNMGGQSQMGQGSLFDMKKKGSNKHHLPYSGGTHSNVNSWW